MPDELDKQIITIFLIAASPVIRQGILSAISESKDMEVIGQVGGSDEPFSITGDIMPRTVALFAITPKAVFRRSINSKRRHLIFQSLCWLNTTMMRGFSRRSWPGHRHSLLPELPASSSGILLDEYITGNG